jgi:hypothetical protein
VYLFGLIKGVYLRSCRNIAISLIGKGTLEFKQMSQTWKDSGRLSMNRLILKVAMNDDGTYQINLNEEVVGNRIPEKWLDDELCGKRGFCGEELAEIKRQLRDGGTAIFTV